MFLQLSIVVLCAAEPYLVIKIPKPIYRGKVKIERIPQNRQYPELNSFYMAEILSSKVPSGHIATSEQGINCKMGKPSIDMIVTHTPSIPDISSASYS